MINYNLALKPSALGLVLFGLTCLKTADEDKIILNE